MQRDRQDGPEPRAARQAEQKRIGERIAHERLQPGAGNPQQPTDQKGEEGAGHSQVPDDIRMQQLPKRHGRRPEYDACRKGEHRGHDQQRPFHRASIALSCAIAWPERGPGRPNREPGSRRK